MVQLAKHEQRQRLVKQTTNNLQGIVLAKESLARTRKRQKITHTTRGAKSTTLKVGFAEEDPLPPSDCLNYPYHISRDQRFHVDLTSLLTSNANDPAYKVFVFSMNLTVMF